MRLSIKNLGKIETADIEINAITIIAGENNTGKSTVGKTLFCIFNSFYKIDEQIEADRLSTISNAIAHLDGSGWLRSFGIKHGVNTDELAKFIITNKTKYINDRILLQQDIGYFIMQNYQSFDKRIEKANLEKVAKDIINILNTSDDEILVSILRNKMKVEFNMQVNNLYHKERESEVTLKIKENKIEIRVKDNEDIKIFGYQSLNTEVLYIDDPYAMDNTRYSIWRPYESFFTHREHLSARLGEIKNTLSVKEALHEIITSKKLNMVFEKLNTVCPGKIVRKSNDSCAYMENGASPMIDIVNVSTGLKTFAIIKTLLLNGCLEENGTLILDEPEIHLHPEWQLIFAELIVLIQKEFNMHILINTHSPYFVDAIEVYSQMHGIASKCKFYLAENTGAMSAITDVSENIERIYKKFARPLQNLENERYSDD